MKTEVNVGRQDAASMASGTGTKDHISICVCTFKRPALLRKLLLTLEELKPPQRFSYSVVVVDNDSSRSAEIIVNDLRATMRTEIVYFHEQQRSISLTRNRSIREASGNLIAFIDDDEFPAADWLQNLHDTLNATGADGVLGPVLPHFETRAASWLPRSGLCDRKRFATGTLLSDPKYTRTGNVLLRRSLFREGDVWFDPLFGLTGGGDAAFFRRMIAQGHRFVWCDDACVYETVLPERQSRSYYVKRAFTRGMTSSQHAALLSWDSLRSLMAVIGYSIALPVLAVVGQHLFVRFLVKDCDHLGNLLGRLGIRPVRERPYVG